MSNEFPGDGDSQRSEPPDGQLSRKKIWHVGDDEELYIPLVPVYRYVRRADGGLEETYRILFYSALTLDEMRQIGSLLARIPEDSAYGVQALIRLDFTLAATCECRYLCTSENWKKRVGMFHAAWERINQISHIHAIDLTPWYTPIEP